MVSAKTARHPSRMPLPKRATLRAAILARVRGRVFAVATPRGGCGKNRGTREIAHPAPEAAPAAILERALARTRPSPMPSPPRASVLLIPRRPTPNSPRPHDAATDEGVARLVDIGPTPSPAARRSSPPANVERASTHSSTRVRRRRRNRSLRLTPPPPPPPPPAWSPPASPTPASTRRAHAAARPEVRTRQATVPRPRPSRRPANARGNRPGSKPNPVEELTEGSKLEGGICDARPGTPDERRTSGMSSDSCRRGGIRRSETPEVSPRSSRRGPRPRPRPRPPSGPGLGRGGGGGVVGVGEGEGDGDGLRRDRHRDETAPARVQVPPWRASTGRRRKSRPPGRGVQTRHFGNDDRFNEIGGSEIARPVCADFSRAGSARPANVRGQSRARGHRRVP